MSNIVFPPSTPSSSSSLTGRSPCTSPVSAPPRGAVRFARLDIDGTIVVEDPARAELATEDVRRGALLQLHAWSDLSASGTKISVQEQAYAYMDAVTEAFQSARVVTEDFSRTFKVFQGSDVMAEVQRRYEELPADLSLDEVKARGARSFDPFALIQWGALSEYHEDAALVRVLSSTVNRNLKTWVAFLAFAGDATLASRYRALYLRTVSARNAAQKA